MLLQQASAVAAAQDATPLFQLTDDVYRTNVVWRLTLEERAALRAACRWARMLVNAAVTGLQARAQRT